MKKILSILFFFTFFYSFSQSDKPQKIPFDLIEETPTYESCDAFESNDGKKKCLSTFLANFAQKNFDPNLINCLKQKTVYSRRKGPVKKCFPLLIPGEKRIYVDFSINTDGKIEDIIARAPHGKLKDEAIRVAKLIPTMSPGKQEGKPVKVTYTLPIDLIAK